MARMSGETLIRQKIAELTLNKLLTLRNVLHMKQHQVTLQQALVALQSDLFSTLTRRKERGKLNLLGDGSAISIYAYQFS